MAEGFSKVPDWFAWENQGAGVAAADLDADGRADLVVLMVDDPPGLNAAYFRVGRGLRADGSVAGGWGPWIEIPDWFSWENQGADAALADLDGDGTPDLIVFAIDNPPGQNQGFYRLGKKLQADGTISGGWGPWIPIPDWFSWDNQHGGITVADIDGDGRPDLVVLMVDNPGAQNAGYYRIGRALDAAGNVTGGWTPWTPVPDWFPWENQGAGVAVADLDGAGLLDLVVFQVDNALTQNQGFYKIGKHLDADGHVQGGWTSWLGLPDWFSWENQGASIALTTLDAKDELVMLMVDNPPGENAGFYRVVGLETDPARQGSWEVLPYHSGVLAVHAALLPGGKVLFFAGSGSSQARAHSPDFGNMAKGIWTSVVWDPTATPADGVANFVHPQTHLGVHGHVFDFFCCGHAFLPDGRLLVGGGNLAYPDAAHGFEGLADACTFDVHTQQWSTAASMHHGRWYPTLTTLGNGQVLASTGLSEANALNTMLERYSPATDTWDALPVPPQHNFIGLPLYAHLFLLSDGRVMFSGGRMDDPSPLGPCILDLTTNPVQVTAIPGLAHPESRNQSSSVLLPPAQDQRVMIIGGGPEEETDSTDSVDIVDLRDPHPTYRAATALNLPRMHLNAVLLPDRTVLVTGGSLKREFGPAARLQPELYDPATDTWTIMATASVARLYHSTALLLPDGRVVTAGGNPEGGHQVAWEPPDPTEEMRLEVFSPPYLFRGPRPVINLVAEQWRYGQTITIQTHQASMIRWVSLIRNGATTHAFDQNQRLVDVPISSRNVDSLAVELTDNPDLAPPGWYMLFLTDANGVPSVASWVRVDHT